ncbi:MAG: hypothetical protein AB8G22_20365 [Saprospiraceae bacterium]
MQRLILLIAILFVGNITLSAQNDAPVDRDKMQEEYQNMQENLQKMLEGMGGTFGFEMDTMMFRDLDQMAMPFFDQLGEDGMMFKMDTMLVQPFGDMQDLENMQLDRENWGEGMAEMMEMMQQMMQNLDMSQMEDMMQGFGFEMPPAVPAPERLDEEGNPLPPAKKKKKRKTYSL